MVRPRHDRLAVAAALGLAGLIALCTFAAVAYRGAIRWVDHTLEVRRAADEWTVALLAADLRARDCVTSDMPTLFESYGDALRLEREKAAHLRELVSDNGIQIENVDAMDRDARAATESFADLVRLVRSGDQSDALTLLAAGESERRVDLFDMDEQRVGEEEEHLLVARRRTSDELALLTFGGGALLAFAAVSFLTSSWTSQRRRAELSDRLSREARAQLEALSDVAAALAEVALAFAGRRRGRRAGDARGRRRHLHALRARRASARCWSSSASAGSRRRSSRRSAASPRRPGNSGDVRGDEVRARDLGREREPSTPRLYPALAATKAQGRGPRRSGACRSSPRAGRVGLLGMGFYEPADVLGRGASVHRDADEAVRAGAAARAAPGARGRGAALARDDAAQHRRRGDRDRRRRGA